MKNAQLKDIHLIMNLIKDAKIFLKSQSINQWQDGYPDYETIRDDILNKRGFLNDDKTAYMAFSHEKEIAYEALNTWQDPNYTVIHRFCRKKNVIRIDVARNFLREAIKKSFHEKKSVRIDTHPDNKLMQKLILSEKFIYRGEVFLESTSKNSRRYCYEKVYRKKRDEK